MDIFQILDLPKDIINTITSFGLISNSLLEEIESVVSQKYWELPDNGRSWSVLPIKLVQTKLKNKLMGELLTRNILGVEVFWDNLEEPELYIIEKDVFDESIRRHIQLYNIDIFEMDDSIYIGGKLFYLELNL